LVFFTNSVEQARISGEVEWEQRTFTIGPGARNLRWSYSKNSSVSLGADRAWVDRVEFTPTPVTITARLGGTPPFNLTWSDGFHQNGINSTTAVRTLTPTSSRTLRITSVTDASGCASGASRDISVIVHTLPGILTQPVGSQRIRGGEAAHLSVAGNGGGLHYQWFEGEPGDERKPVGADDPALVTEALCASKVYWVKVTNGCGTLASQRAEVLIAATKRRPTS